jgi:hypothetical protein
MYYALFLLQQATEHSHATMDMFTTEEMMMATCFICGDDYPDERKVLGYRVCLMCGIDTAKAESIQKQSMVQPINKSTPTYIADFTLLKQLNPKRTT